MAGELFATFAGGVGALAFSPVPKSAGPMSALKSVLSDAASAIGVGGWIVGVKSPDPLTSGAVPAGESLGTT